MTGEKKVMEKLSSCYINFEMRRKDFVWELLYKKVGNKVVCRK